MVKWKRGFSPNFAKVLKILIKAYSIQKRRYVEMAEFKILLIRRQSFQLGFRANFAQMLYGCQ